MNYINLPLKDISIGKNIRIDTTGINIGDLTESIRSHGLLENLIVQKSNNDAKTPYRLVAGFQRVRAIRELMKKKHITAKETFSCLIIAEGANASEIALAENTARTAMHPADQALVFKNLIEKDKIDIAEIAGRFNTTERQIKRRLAIASVHKSILDDYRQGKINYDSVKIFAGMNDPNEQERIYKKMCDKNWSVNANSVKSFVTKARISICSNEIVFIGLQAYIDGGGQIEEDLFAEQPQDALTATNSEVIKELVDKKLSTYGNKFNQNWNWIKSSQETSSYDVKTKYDAMPPTRNAEKVLKSAQKASADVINLMMSLTKDTELNMENAIEKIQAVTDKIDAAVEKLIEAINKSEYEDFVMENGGIYITFYYSMIPTIEAGLLDKRFLKEKRKKESKVAVATANGPTAETSTETVPETRPNGNDQEPGYKLTGLDAGRS